MPSPANVPRQPLRPRQDAPGAGRSALEQEYGKFPTPKPGSPAQMINLEAVALFRSSYTFVFRHLRYTVRRLSWFDGITLEYIRDEVVRVMQLPTTEAHLLRLEALYLHGFDIMWRYARPRGWWWRGRWRNEFRDATYAEFTQLASFFSECQMLLPDLALDTTPGSLTWMARRRPLIWPMGGASSRSRSRTSATGTVRPSVMSIIASGSGGSK